MQPIPAPRSLTTQLTSERLAAHAYALDASGWTVVPGQLDGTSIDALRASADLAVAATRRAIAEQRAGKHTVVSDTYSVARRFYHWSQAAFALLDHPAVHALAARMLGSYRLFDHSVNATHPASDGEGTGTGWHRDFGSDLHHGSAVPSHLFLLFCLDDLTSENGGVRIVPGSQRRCLQPEPHAGDEGYPTSLRIAARAGDLVALDPAALHASGINRSASDRRLVAVSLCHGRVPPACDHWRLLGDDERVRCSPRVRNLLSFDWDQDHASWAVLPDGRASGAAERGR